MKLPVARLRMRQMKWYIDLEYDLGTRKKEFSIGPFGWVAAKALYEERANQGKWFKEGIVDR